MNEISHDIAMLALNECGSAAICDAEGRYIFLNKKWLDGMDVKAEDILGRYIWDVLPDTKVRYVLETHKPLLQQVLLTGTAEKVRRTFCNYHPLFKDGEFIGVFVETSFNGLDLALKFSQEVIALSKDLAEAKEKLHRYTAAPKYDIDNIIGKSEAVQVLKMEIIAAARTASSVLIEGETGVGKELVAHSIHSLSDRRTGSFVRVNCSAIPENLMESEFFGYEGGAFTGAQKGGKAGKFERATGGSLFLDEIGELPLHMQPKFLRVLQEQEIERVGGSRVIPIDTRIIAATNVSLEDLVQRRTFRQDLYYRLNVIRIRVPPLRERKEDIPYLVKDVVSRLNARLSLEITDVDDAVYDMLLRYDWPGNIRELQNTVESAMNRAYEGVLMVDHFDFMKRSVVHPAILPFGQGPSEAFTSLRGLPPDREYEAIRAAIDACGGEKKRAAKLLGISRSTLYDKLKKYETK